MPALLYEQTLLSSRKGSVLKPAFLYTGNSLQTLISEAILIFYFNCSNNEILSYIRYSCSEDLFCFPK